MKSNNGVKRFPILDIGLFFLVVIVIGYLQYLLLAPHLLYGFADVDWTFLYRFKNLSPLSLNQLMGEWRASGVYTYQTYYIGIQEMFYHLAYEKYHLTTNIFRFLSTVTLYPLLWYFTRSRVLSALTVIIYAVSYTAIGAMYTVVTSGIYLAVTILNIFLLVYVYLIKTGKQGWPWIIVLFILFFSALLLSTERLYPLFPLLLMVELFLLWRAKFARLVVVASAKRSLLIIVPLVLGLLYKPYASTNVQFLGNTKLLIEKILVGNWHLLLVPFTSLGGLFVPREYWKYFGVVNDLAFTKYLEFYISTLGITFIVLTILLALAASKKPVIFVLKTLIPTIFLGLVSFFIINHQLFVPAKVNMHYDPQIYLIPALIGQYILSLSLAFFEEWRLGQFKNILHFCAFFGPFVAFLFIVLTWLPAEPGLEFTSVHRYLTVPGIGSSLFIATAMVLFFHRLQTLKFFKSLSLVIFLLLIPLVWLNGQVTQDYFKYELNFAGTNGHEQQRMKDKLRSYLTDFDRNKPSLFYFDESRGGDNGYFHETTLLAGFNFWMMFWDNRVLDSKAMPGLMRSSLLCPGQAVTCLDTIKTYVEKRNGIKGINFGQQFYQPKNIYAFRLADRDVVNIRGEFFKEMGLTNER